MTFDLLELDGEDQRKRPLRERRQALEHLLRGERLILPVRRLNSSGLEAWKEVLRAGYEGLIGQRPGVDLRAGTHVEVAQGQAEGSSSERAGILPGVEEKSASDALPAPLWSFPRRVRRQSWPS
jgi:hypothetical protein